MRIIAGRFRSRRLKGPGRFLLRPTSDRLRETLFNILGPAVEGSLFLDLFAGTGAVGIEALSRGAREVYFVESHPRTARLVAENLNSFGVRDSAEVLVCDVLSGLDRLASRHLLADFVYLDPPYARLEDLNAALDALDDSHLIAPSGIVIAEHSSRAELPARLARLERFRLLEQGDASLSFYRLAAAA